MNNLVIYTLSDPRTKEVRYVGVTGGTLQSRLSGHIHDKSNTHKVHWIQSLRDNGLKPEIKEIESCDENNWDIREQFYISYFRSIGANLTNANDGGKGNLNSSPETREKISNANKGRQLTEIQKEKYLLAQFARRGRPMPGHGEKMSRALKGRIRPQAESEKARLSNIGKVRSLETREKLRQSHLGNKLSPETCAKLSAVKKGKVKSETHKQAIRDAIKLWWAGRKANEST